MLGDAWGLLTSDIHRPHRPRLPPWSRNTCNSLHSYAVDKRAVLMGAVGILSMAVDNSWQYRPQESLQNATIRAVRSLLCGVF
jgi:hypothetical protein